MVLVLAFLCMPDLGEPTQHQSPQAPWKGQLPGGLRLRRWLCTDAEGALVAGGGQGGQIVLWDATTQSVRWRRPIPEGTVIHGIKPDMACLSAVINAPRGEVVVSGGSGRIAVLEIVNGRLARMVVPGGRAPKPGQEYQVQLLACTRDGRMIYSAGPGGQVVAWDAATWRPLRTMRILPAGFIVAAVSRDGQRLAAVGKADRVAIWDVRSCRMVRQWRAGSRWVSPLAWSPDGKDLVAGCSDGIARVWEAATGRLRANLAAGRAPIGCVAFSPDGRRLATGAVNGLEVTEWDTRTWRRARTASLETFVYGLGYVRSLPGPVIATWGMAVCFGRQDEWGERRHRENEADRRK
jgi:WD40 repeat protein